MCIFTAPEKRDGKLRPFFQFQKTAGDNITINAVYYYAYSIFTVVFVHGNMLLAFSFCLAEGRCFASGGRIISTGGNYCDRMEEDLPERVEGDLLHRP